ncbi:hypothetical protein GCM10009689_17380 [Brevibacterium antiquum]|uniref:hypothetical protein n=1 Tax=Brevibacterium antiquum TaxID=234835 RepID=UPI0018DF8E56|nr:hypothetical protein [Brevibacterium antiquum]
MLKLLQMANPDDTSGSSIPVIVEPGPGLVSIDELSIARGDGFNPQGLTAFVTFNTNSASIADGNTYNLSVQVNVFTDKRSKPHIVDDGDLVKPIADFEDVWKIRYGSSVLGKIQTVLVTTSLELIESSQNSVC